MVEWMKLDTCLDFEQPTAYLVKSTEYDDSYDTPVLTAGQSLLLGYTNETDGIYEASKEKPCIIFDDFTTSFHWIDYSFKVKSSAMKMLRPRKGVNFRYVYYSMCGINFVPGGHQRHWISKYSQFEIPIPSLEEQTRIVGILDTFTSAIDNLKEQIAQRRKQYEYYRDQLLDLEGKEGVEIAPLRRIVKSYCTGATPNKGHLEYYESGTIPWLRTQDVKFNEIYEIDSFVTEEAVAKTGVKWIPANCVIVAISGATAGRCAINKIPTTTNQHCLNLEINPKKALYKYVYYCVYNAYSDMISKKQGARGDLNSSIILGITIPVPSLSEQQRIVSILDTFEASIQNLEAQLEQRQKQYEYYRNKLLTFE